jgi:2-methylcitrate dehydratase PrpD
MSQVAFERPDATGLTRKIAEHGASLAFDSLPDDVVAIAKSCLIDWLGVTLAGSYDALAEMLQAEAAEQGGAEQATVIGGKSRTSVLQAALLNGTASHALDYDDVNLSMPGHPTVPVVPAILALAERDGFDGRAFITAFIAGVESEVRIGALMGEAHYQKGWHTTGTVGTFGAAAGAAHMLGLDIDSTVAAYGIAGTQAAGLKSNFGTMCKPLHAGKAAANGLYAALLAKRGFTSNPEILECVQGFGDTQTDNFQPDLALAGLGETFHARGILFKYHAACYGTHASIEAAVALREQHDLAADRIEKVEVRVPASYQKMCNIQNPTTGLEGKFSLRFTTAMAFAGANTARTDSYSAETCADPKIVSLRDRINVVPEEKWEHANSEVIVSTNDGVVLRQMADASIAETDQARQWARLADKFRGLAEPAIGAEKAEKVVEAVGRLEAQDSLVEIAELCRG